jgi:hypothetical protein
MLKLGKTVNATCFSTSENIEPKEFQAPLIVSFLVCIIAYVTYRLALVESLLADVTVKYRTKLSEHLSEARKFKEENIVLREQLNIAQESYDADTSDEKSNADSGDELDSSTPPGVASCPASRAARTGSVTPTDDDGFLVIE